MPKTSGGAFGPAGITSGTIDGAVIGGVTPAAITGTNITATNILQVKPSATAFFAVNQGNYVSLGPSVPLQWVASGDANAAGDLALVRAAAATLSVQGSSTAVDALLRKNGGNAGLVEWGSISENLTLSTSGTTTNTAANLLPANSYIEYVTARVTTTVATATSWQLGDATIAGRFTAAQSGAQLTLGATVVGTVHVDLTGTSGPRQTAASTLRVTTVGTPSAGAIRITSYYRSYTPATS